MSYIAIPKFVISPRTAAVEFAGQSYPVMELDGGWRWWKDDGFTVEK